MDSPQGLAPATPAPAPVFNRRIEDIARDFAERIRLVDPQAMGAQLVLEFHKLACEREQRPKCAPMFDAEKLAVDVGQALQLVHKPLDDFSLRIAGLYLSNTLIELKRPDLLPPDMR
jgi:hypothetical protein